jgi:hypothetical protein
MPRAANPPTRTHSRCRPPRGLMDRVVWRPIGGLKEVLGNPRRHPESQIAGLMKSIRRFWTNPILVDETTPFSQAADGGKRQGAWGMTHVPIVMVSGLSDVEKRAVDR